MIFLPFLASVGAAFFSEFEEGRSSLLPVYKSPVKRQREAISEYGTTDNPVSVGFILSSGEWLDFSEGTYGPRTEDHRHVGHLLQDGERASEWEQNPQTKNMDRWMDLTHAMRVHRSGARRGDYAMLDLPQDPEALRAVLRARRSIYRYLEGCDLVEVNGPGGFKREVDPYEPTLLAEVFDELLSDLPPSLPVLR